ncbi:class I SAM-dependent methyltransferase [Pseudoxanthomonas sp. CAU 1598]|uniref:Class I SAM-dependent methyltransferase n=1 Tax=Pseudomarimonas arenosa TaxID=2774145 RepID=A0AAW3ZLC5_9GAMM|nr:class I SAM-dependent methyltransferase [Pseudomarimonas arenosa]
MAALLAGCGPNTPGTDTAPSAAANVPEPAAAPASEPVSPLQAAIAGEWRDPANVARDQWRHPQQTLEFFGIQPNMRVVEITPGGGWYTEILAPWLAPQGQLVAALIDPASSSSERARSYYSESNQKLRDKLAAQPQQYRKVELVEFSLTTPSFGTPASADAVLTFRNVHNWINAGAAPGMFKGFFEVLKPGGVLGVVEHRANSDVPEGDRSGYMSEQQVIALATAAGFVLDEKSEINANLADTKDHPNGVWSLPPGNRHDEADAAKYQAIGESDRMTLRFRKPAG